MWNMIQIWKNTAGAGSLLGPCCLIFFSTVDGCPRIWSIPDPFSWWAYAWDECGLWFSVGVVGVISIGRSPCIRLGESHCLPSSLKLICTAPSVVRHHSWCGWSQDSTNSANILASYGNQGVTGIQGVIRWFRPLILIIVAGGCPNTINEDRHFVVTRSRECSKIIQTYEHNEWRTDQVYLIECVLTL